VGGAELWQVRFAKFLQAQGDQVYFFLRPGKFAELVEKRGFELSRIQMGFDLDPVGIFELYRGFKKFRPEVVIFNDQRELRLGVISAGLARVPLKVQRKGFSFLKGSLRDRLYYGRLDYVVAVSRAIEELYREKLGMGSERLIYLPNGVNLDRFDKVDGKALRKKLGIADDEILIGMAGRLERQKRQGDLIRAGKLLVERGYKIRVALAGEGRDRQSLARLATGIGMDKRVAFLGFLDSIEEFLAGLDIFVFCSEWEGMPNTVLEAMAAGRPVVAADIAGVREVIEHGKNGLLYEAGKVEELAERVESLIRDRGRAERMGAEARATISERFDERKIFLDFLGWLRKKVETEK
jgi:glycosyltransferase involved in cell wall biosynthesis